MHSNANCTFEATAVDPFAATYINSQQTYRCRFNLPRSLSLSLQPPQQAKTRAQSMPKPKPRNNSNSNSNNKRRHNAARRHNLDAIILVFPTLSSDTTHFIALLWQLLCHGLWPAEAAGSRREVGGWVGKFFIAIACRNDNFHGAGKLVKSC